MSRVAAIVASVAVLVGVPAVAMARDHGGPAKGAPRTAAAKHRAHKRRGRTARFAPLRGEAGPARAFAPSSWSATGFAVPGLAAPTPTPTPAPSAPTPTPTPISTVPAPSTHSVSVGSTEFKFTLSQSTVDPGDVKVQFDNSRAEDPHQLMVVGTDDLFDFGELGPGQVKRLTLHLKSGTYDLLCPIDDHESRGMSARLTVR